MQRGIGVLLALIIIGSVASAAVIQEFSFASLEVGTIQVNGTNQVGCQDINVPVPAQVGAEGIFPVLSLVANFAPIADGPAEIDVYANPNWAKSAPPAANDSSNGLIATIHPLDFQENKSHTVLNQTILSTAGFVTLRLCPRTSETITTITIAPDSQIGWYRMPYFAPENFTKTMDQANPIVGQDALITIRAKNTGSESAIASLTFRDLELKVLQITTGDSDFTGEIKPGQEVVLSYYVKPKFAGPITPVSARLSYTGIFGEQVEVRSTRPTVNVVNPPFQVEGLLSAGVKSAQPNESIPVTLTIRNNGQNELAGVVVTVSAPKEATLSQTRIPLPVLGVGEVRNIPIQVTSATEGKFQVGCQATLEETSQETRCDKITLTFEKKGDNPALLLVVGMLVLGAAIYAYVYHVPKKRAPAQE